MARWLFDVIQGGEVVASGDAPDQAGALSSAGHYTMVYGQDGPCESIVRRPGDRVALRRRQKMIATQIERGDRDKMIEGWLRVRPPQ